MHIVRGCGPSWSMCRSRRRTLTASGQGRPDRLSSFVVLRLRRGAAFSQKGRHAIQQTQEQSVSCYRREPWHRGAVARGIGLVAPAWRCTIDSQYILMQMPIYWGSIDDVRVRSRFCSRRRWWLVARVYSLRTARTSAIVPVPAHEEEGPQRVCYSTLDRLGWLNPR